MKPIVLMLSLSALGCAHGVDGLRQTCTNAENIVSGGYQLATAQMKSDLATLRSEVVTGTDGSAKKLLDHEALYSKTILALNTSRYSIQAVCDLAPAIEAGMKQDIPALITKVLSMAASVQQAVLELKGAL